MANNINWVDKCYDWIYCAVYLLYRQQSVLWRCTIEIVAFLFTLFWHADQRLNSIWTSNPVFLMTSSSKWCILNITSSSRICTVPLLPRSIQPQQTYVSRACVKMNWNFQMEKGVNNLRKLYGVKSIQRIFSNRNNRKNTPVRTTLPYIIWWMHSVVLHK